jgi:hypothetical protein
MSRDPEVRKIRIKASAEADRKSNLYVQPTDLVEPIVEAAPGVCVLAEAMPAREVPLEGELIEVEG